jgi:hypothetical protein
MLGRALLFAAVAFPLCYACSCIIWWLSSWWGVSLWLGFLLATGSNVAISAELWQRIVRNVT